MEKCLEEIFKHLHMSCKNLDSRLKAEGFKARVIQVLKAWEEWLVYDQDYLNKLKTTFLGIAHVRQFYFGHASFFFLILSIFNH